MPSSSDALRNKFMINDSDGIGEAEDIIIRAGGTVSHGLITLPSECSNDVLEATQFLIEEWDYATE